jgi:hypothetical protein
MPEWAKLLVFVIYLSLACTLLPYDERFELGQSLEEAMKPVALAHPYCATFCVLGGGCCGVVR